MGEITAASNPSLQVSVSFGRFENDSLSWERWSSFSPNKYLEEVERCATPGSVAQKKAYFEAHYKKIAARKAEELLAAQEKQTEKDSSRSEYQNGADLSGNSCGTDAEFETSNTLQGSNEEVKQETNSAGEISRTNVDNLGEEVAAEGENKELENRSNSSHQTEDKLEESLHIEVEEDVKEISHVVYKETGKGSEVEGNNVKLDHPMKSKVTSLKKESNVAKTKKLILPSSKASQISTPRSTKATLTPTSKASQISTPRSTKPTLTPTSKASQISTPISTKATLTPTFKASQISTARSTKPTLTPPKTLTSASSTKKGSSPSLTSRRQVTSIGESRKVANRSLHMSLSLGPSDPDPAPPHTTMRKSFIMENMGDKDIVRRAFKTFQNSFNQPKSSTGEDTSLVPSRGTVPKVPTSTALQKENGRSTKFESTNRRSGNSVRTIMGPKSGIGADKGKESSRKAETNSKAKEAERMRLQSKLKEEKEAEMKKLKHNFKATPLPTFYRGQKASKSYSEKGDAKTENRR